jgi:aspartate carbamoyltransferase catalytic subunit
MDIISMSHFSKSDILYVLEEAKQFKSLSREKKSSFLTHKNIGLLFFEPSTRTRLSFSTAVQNLGGREIGFSDALTTSTSKGESFMDTIRVVERYCDVLVIRHPLSGSARLASEISKRPIINAGDGSNQHPTQTLLDLFTIQEAFGKIDGLNIGFVGDLRYGRTVHSLSKALTHFNVNQYFISPQELMMPEYLKKEVDQFSKSNETSSLEEFLSELDVLYCTRIQKERFPDEMEYNRVKDAYVIDVPLLKNAKKELKDPY